MGLLVGSVEWPTLDFNLGYDLRVTGSNPELGSTLNMETATLSLFLSALLPCLRYLSLSQILKKFWRHNDGFWGLIVDLTEHSTKTIPWSHSSMARDAKTSQILFLLCFALINLFPSSLGRLWELLCFSQDNTLTFYVLPFYVLLRIRPSPIKIICYLVSFEN